MLGLEEKRPRWGVRTSNPGKSRLPVLGGFDSHSLPPQRRLPAAAWSTVREPLSLKRDDFYSNRHRQICSPGLSDSEIRGRHSPISKAVPDFAVAQSGLRRLRPEVPAQRGLLDDVVGASEQPSRYVDAKGLRGPVVDNQLEPCRKHHRRLGRYFAFENLASINAG